MLYKERKTAAISFPLGGIGAGCIGLGGNGQLKDWEIFNRPAKGSLRDFSHFAVKAEAGGKVLDARVLVGDSQPPFDGSMPGGNYGHSHPRETLQGLPHFEKSEFEGSFPFAEITFRDRKFPGRVKLTAFNPFIPLNDRDSSIPAAFFQVSMKNTASRSIRYTAALSLKLPGDTSRFRNIDGCRVIVLDSRIDREDDPAYSDLSIATDAGDCSYQEYWYRGAWFDNLGIYWRDFCRPGKLTTRTYPKMDKTFSDHATLAGHFDLKPGEEKSLRFIVAWNTPNMTAFWREKKTGDNCGCDNGCRPKTWKNYYATIFQNSTDSACYSLRNWDRLHTETLKFKKALFSSTLPDYVLDAVSANISILKSPTVLRLEDGSFYGFEGCSPDCGCCEGSCTHVWNYAYALPFLFPKLERSMRDLDYRYNLRPDGKMLFRLALPPGEPLPENDWRACADGQFGGIIKAYRDWKICGDDQWLRSLWPSLKKALEFAWAETNEDKWDRNKDGVLEGRQHHTLDTELFGPNAYLTGFYLAALKAAAEMAEYFGEKDKSREYAELFRKGKQWVDRNLFNGEYYQQKIDLKDKKILEPYGQTAAEFYWDQEHGEIKHQTGSGCHCDQVIGQWHANICGLGEIFDGKQVKKALKAIHKYNFRKSMRDFVNVCRIYALNDEAALVICTWPKDNKPTVPLTYAEEAMNGFEYQVAVHLIQEGMVKEGLEIVKAVRDRYDGEKRNPWNEFECGSNYARSMASYALLPALSGFVFDLVKKHIGFKPVLNGKDFRCFWSLDSGWGIYQRKGNRITLKVEAGAITLNSFSDSALEKAQSVKAGTVSFRKDKSTLIFSCPVTVKAGGSLTVTFRT